MADKAPLKATFFAFQKREQGGVLVKATVAYLVVALVIGGAFFALNWQALGPVGAWYLSIVETPPGVLPDVSQPPSELLSLAPGYLVVSLAAFVLLAAFEAACLRWLVRGETEGLFGLSLGADTWRVWAGYWVWMLVILGSYIVSILIVLAVTLGGGFVLGLVGDQLGAAGGMASILGGIFLVVTMLLAYLFPAYVATRFAPAAATSIALRKFAFLKAWTVTRKRFWALFGSFLLLGIIYLVALLLTYGAAIFTVLGAAAGDIAATSGPGSVLPETVIAAMNTSTGIATLAAFYAVILVIGMSVYVAFYGVNARAALAALEEDEIVAEIKPSASAAS